MKYSGKVNPEKQKADWRLPGLGQGQMRSCCVMGKELSFGVMKMFWNVIKVMVTQHTTL